MKTLDIVLLAAGVGMVGYLVYKNKDQLTPKPLTDADNEPLRSSFDTGTNNGQGYKTEEEKPASDPVILAETAAAQVTEVPVTNAINKQDVSYTTGEQPSVGLPELDEKITAIPKYYTTTPYPDESNSLKPVVAVVSPSAPVTSITNKQEQYPTLLYNNSERNIQQQTYDFGQGFRDDSYKYVEAL